MANEVTLTSRLQVAHGGSTYLGDTTKQFDILGNGHKYAGRQELTTSAEDIDLGPDLTFSEVRVIWIKNNSVTTGENVILVKSAVEFGEIRPGEAYPIPVKADGTAIQVKSATGTPSIDVVAG